MVPPKSIMQCYSCGNMVPMDSIASCRVDVNEHFDYLSALPFATEWVKRWELFLCPTCLDVVMIQHEARQQPGGITHTQKLLYPIVGAGHGVPENIDQSYRSALKVKKDGPICCLALRRTLEIVCKDKGETKGELIDKLKRLAERGVIPPILEAMTHILRKIGNEAAHGDDKEFPPEIVVALIDFTKTILEYIYVLPKKLAEIQETIKER